MRPVEYVLFDSLQGGSGQKFDWTRLQAPEGAFSQGWFLAGGLVPDNVAEAVRIARPYAVDVSSGVCGPDGLMKDHDKVRMFIANARGL